MQPEIDSMDGGGADSSSAMNYLCSFCGKSLKTLASLKKHQILHSGTKLCCEYCGKILASKRSLASHLVTYHGKGIEKAHTCGVCGKHFKRRSTWAVHVNSHDQIRPFQCDICSKSFTQKKSLVNHLLIHNGGATKQTEKVGSLDRSILNVENSAQHLATTSDNLNGKSARAPQGSTVVDKTKSCADGGLERPRPIEYETFHEQLTPNLTRNQTSGNLLNLDAVPTKICCTVCQKRFTQKSKLKRHLKLHFEEPQFRCEICCQKFYRKDNLDIHTQKHSITSSEFVCRICDKKFAELPGLKKHLEYHMHPNFSCILCLKTFTTQAAQRDHHGAHRGDTKFSCSHCSKTFVRKCHYDSHKIIHEENFIQCEKCFKKFNGKVYYNRHMKRAHK